jgi:hypothetical protein
MYQQQEQQQQGIAYFQLEARTSALPTGTIVCCLHVVLLLVLQGRLAGTGISVKPEQQAQEASTSASAPEAGHAAPGLTGSVARVILPGAVSNNTMASGSHISSKALTGAAAAAGAGIKVSGGLLSADCGPEGGLRLFYDKLTLLLDSGLPLGGNCKVWVWERVLLAVVSPPFAQWERVELT